MKVNELIKVLGNYDPETEVSMSGDGIVADVISSAKLQIVDDEGVIFDDGWTAEEAQMDNDDWEEYKKSGPRELILS